MIRHLIAFLVLTLGPAQAGVSLASELFRNGSEIKIEAPIGVLPVSGFLPLRVEMRNEGRSEMKWKLACESSLGNSYEGSNLETGSISSDFTVTCPAGELRSVDLLLPIHTGSASFGIREVRVSGHSEGMQARLSGSMGAEGLNITFGLSEKLLEDLSDELAEAWNMDPRYISAYGVSGSLVLGAAIDPDQLPSDWRAYAGYDALALSEADYLKQKEGVKLALDQWVRSGGNLILLGESGTAPEGFEQGSRSKGLGVQSFLDCGAGFTKFDGDEFRGLMSDERVSLLKKIELEHSSFPWAVGAELGERKLQKSLLLTALIVFGIVVGPVNLFFWAGRDRRHRLFFTTPLISLVASLLLVGFIVLRDGFGGEGTRAALIEVGGPDDKTAVTLQEQFSRNGVLLSSNFTLDKDAVFSPVKAPTSDLNQYDSVIEQGNYQLETSATEEGLEFSGDLYQSRSENALVLRAVKPSRERLTLLSEGTGAPQLTSSFSYSLTKVFYTDAEGKVWTTPSIEPGGTVTMSAADGKEPNDELSGAVLRFGEFNRKTITRLLNRKGSFAALAEEAPGLETHPAIEWRKSPTLITGLLGQ